MFIQNFNNLKVVLLCVASVTLSGCVTSPINTGKKSPMDAGTLLTMAVGGAAGGFIGNELAPGGLGAAAGTGIGLLGAAILSDAASQYTERQKAEAYESGKRAARLEVMEQYWYDQTTSYNPNAGKDISAGNRPIRDLRYDSMISEGVRLDSSFRPVSVGPYEPTRTGANEMPQ